MRCSNVYILTGLISRNLAKVFNVKTSYMFSHSSDKTALLAKAFSSKNQRVDQSFLHVEKNFSEASRASYLPIQKKQQQQTQLFKGSAITKEQFHQDNGISPKIMVFPLLTFYYHINRTPV